MVEEDLPSEPREQRAVRVRLHLRGRARSLPGSGAEEAREGVEVGAADRDCTENDDRGDGTRDGRASQRELAAAHEHEAERGERRQQAEHRRERTCDDHPERAADCRDDAESPAELETRNGERDDADEQRAAGERGEVCRGEERRLAPPCRSRREDRRAEELRDADDRREGAPQRE
jgi:hypothetical protein